MNKSVIAAGAAFCGVFGVLLGINLTKPDTGSSPVQEIVIVNGPSELPSPSPTVASSSPTPEATSTRPSYVPPKTNPPSSENPEAGGGTGGGFAGGMPKITGSPQS